MSSRNKTGSDGGLTNYMVWILVGFLMGRRIVCDKLSRCTMLHPNGTIEVIHMSAIGALMAKHYLEAVNNCTAFKPTIEGFNLAHDRMKKAGAKTYKMNIDVNGKPIKPVDSSLYIG